MDRQHAGAGLADGEEQRQPVDRLCKADRVASFVAVFQADLSGQACGCFVEIGAIIEPVVDTDHGFLLR
ncbi:hypothetical protein D3C86_2009360 [compost metagenome]